MVYLPGARKPEAQPCPPAPAPLPPGHRWQMWAQASPRPPSLAMRRVSPDAALGGSLSRLGQADNCVAGWSRGRLVPWRVLLSVPAPDLRGPQGKAGPQRDPGESWGDRPHPVGALVLTCRPLTLSKPLPLSSPSPAFSPGGSLTQH